VDWRMNRVLQNDGYGSVMPTTHQLCQTPAFAVLLVKTDIHLNSLCVDIPFLPPCYSDTTDDFL
jgi:hypothetical protein